MGIADLGKTNINEGITPKVVASQGIASLGKPLISTTPTTSPLKTVAGWFGIENPDTYVQDALKQASETIQHPIKAIGSAIGAAGGAIGQAFTGLGKNVGELISPKQETVAERTANLLYSVGSVAQVIFSPISAAFSAAEKLPVLKEAADVISAPFAITGTVGNFAAEKFVDVLPIDNASKDILKPAFGEVGALAGQILLGGRVMNMMVKGAKLSKAKVDKLVEEVKTETETAKIKAQETQPKGIAELGVETPKIGQETPKIAKKYPTIHEGGIVKMVEGEPVKIIDGVETFLHKGDGGWIVSEASTGRFISESRTSDGAIAKADFILSDIPKDELLKTLKERQLPSPKIAPETYPVGTKIEITSPQFGSGKVIGTIEEATAGGAGGRPEKTYKYVKLGGGRTDTTKLENFTPDQIKVLSSPKISPELQPLAQEAKKYKSAEEFVKNDLLSEKTSKLPSKEYAPQIGTESPLNKYGNYLYHETNYTNTENLLRDLTSGYPETLYLSNTPELALGQGGKKGFTFIFDSKEVTGFEKRIQKPSGEFLRQQGKTDELIGKSFNKNSIVGLKVPVDFKFKSYYRNADGSVNILENTLKKYGLDTKNPIVLKDGSKVFTKSQLTDFYNQVVGGVKETPIAETKPSKIGLSIESKAIEDKLTKGFESTAEYEPIQIKEQAQKVSDLINTDVEKARRVINGTEPLPEGIKGTSLITGMEEYIKKNPNADLAYELANSPLVSETSLAAQELRLAAERNPDSATAKLIEIKKARQEKVIGKTTKRDVINKVKSETEKINLPKEELSWNKFLENITC